MINSIEHDSSTNGSGASREREAADIFSDLAALRLTADEAGQIGSEEVLAHVSVRKPSINEFVRVNPDPKMSLATSIFVDPERETYFVAPGARNVLVAGVKAMLLLATVNSAACFSFGQSRSVMEAVGATPGTKLLARRRNWLRRSG